MTPKSTPQTQSLIQPSPTFGDHPLMDELERLAALYNTKNAPEVDRAGQAVDLRTAVDTFILDCQAGGLAAATVRWYSSLLQALVTAFVGSKVLASITTNDLRKYIISLQERDTRYDGAGQRPKLAGKLSDSTLNGHNRALHTFFGWCAREYKIADPMAGIRRPKMQKGHPRAIDSGDFVALFDACRDDESGHRDRALLAFLADTGARVGELCSTRQDKLFERQAIVTGKTGSRIVVFSHYTRGLLTLWLSNRTLDQSPYVFTSLTTGEPLGTSGVDQTLRRLKKAAGVKGRVNPHSFRHAFAREYLRAGGDAIRLAKLLGHDSVDTTAAYYAIFTADELAESHEQLSPLRRMLGAK